MAIDSTRGTSGLGAPTPSAVQRDAPGLGKDAFMKLLIAQLKNQGPELAHRLQGDGHAALPAHQRRAARDHERPAGQRRGGPHLDSQLAVGGPGGAREVQADVKAVWLGDQGSASVPFTLDARASRVTITIRDADGRVVRRQELGDTFPGTRAWTWDGRSDSGDRLPAGRYRIDVAAQSSAGTPVGISTRVSGRVDEVSFRNGYPELVIGEARMLLGDVVSIAP